MATKTIYSFKYAKKYPNFPITKEVIISAASSKLLRGEQVTGTDSKTYIVVDEYPAGSTKVMGFEKFSDMEFDSKTVEV